MTDEQARVVTERDGRIFHIVLNRADKMNAFDLRMLRELAEVRGRNLQILQLGDEFLL